jgi:hypothetical protein
MNQRTHAWIAVRAVALLEEQKLNPPLLNLLQPQARKAAIGAWVPDLADMKRGGGNTQHHVLKILPYDGVLKERFIAAKSDLLGRLAGGTSIREYLRADAALDSAWWSQPYKADPLPGQHLANRAMAVFTALRDLLIIGDPAVDALVPGKVTFLKDVDPQACTHCQQAALYLFMLSHFLADACMPCHCDGRKCTGYSAGWHEQWESHWSKMVGTDFDQKNLLPGTKSASQDTKVLDQARAVDDKIGLRFDTKIPALPAGRDVWLETVDMCRASFALAQIAAPVGRWSQQAKEASFDEIFAGPDGQTKLENMDRAILQDAVLNTAMIWNDLWGKVSKPD